MSNPIRRIISIDRSESLARANEQLRSQVLVLEKKIEEQRRQIARLMDLERKPPARIGGKHPAERVSQPKPVLVRREWQEESQ